MGQRATLFAYDTVIMHALVVIPFIYKLWEQGPTSTASTCHRLVLKPSWPPSRQQESAKALGKKAMQAYRINVCFSSGRYDLFWVGRDCIIWVSCLLGFENGEGRQGDDDDGATSGGELYALAPGDEV